MMSYSVNKNRQAQRSNHRTYDTTTATAAGASDQQNKSLINKSYHEMTKPYTNIQLQSKLQPNSRILNRSALGTNQTNDRDRGHSVGLLPKLNKSIL